MRWTGRGQVLALVVLGCLAVTRPVGAQAIRGEVVEDESGLPVEDVRVGLFTDDGTMVARARSDGSGRFSVDAPADGGYRLHLARAGYRSVSGGPYDLREGLVLEVLVVLHLTPIAMEGMEVEVEGRSRRLESAGFYDRRDEGGGHFFDREDLLSRGAPPLADFLSRVPWLEASVRSRPFGENDVRRPALFFRKGGLSCAPALWVDGRLVQSGGSASDPLRPDDWVSTDDVAGLEFYEGPSAVPAQFGHSAACAVLVVWTRGGIR